MFLFQNLPSASSPTSSHLVEKHVPVLIGFSPEQGPVHLVVFKGLAGIRRRFLRRLRPPPSPNTRTMEARTSVPSSSETKPHPFQDLPGQGARRLMTLQRPPCMTRNLQLKFIFFQLCCQVTQTKRQRALADTLGFLYPQGDMLRAAGRRGPLRREPVEGLSVGVSLMGTLGLFLLSVKAQLPPHTPASPQTQWGQEAMN